MPQEDKPTPNQYQDMAASHKDTPHKKITMSEVTWECTQYHNENRNTAEEVHRYLQDKPSPARVILLRHPQHMQIAAVTLDITHHNNPHSQSSHTECHRQVILTTMVVVRTITYNFPSAIPSQMRSL